MNKKEAKSLKPGDRIRITYLYATYFGRVTRIGRVYVYYTPEHPAPPFQRAKFDVVEKVHV